MSLSALELALLGDVALTGMSDRGVVEGDMSGLWGGIKTRVANQGDRGMMVSMKMRFRGLGRQSGRWTCVPLKMRLVVWVWR